MKQDDPLNSMKEKYTNEAIAEIIKKSREEKKLTISQAAEICDMAPSTFSNLETGKQRFYNARMYSQAKICRFLGIKHEDVFVL